MARSRRDLELSDGVREAVLESIDALPRINSDDIMRRDGRVFEMVLEHECMHQETLLYMMQELPIGKKNRPQKAPRYSFEAAVPARRIAIPAGTVRMGARFDQLTFGWDNEFSELWVEVPRFFIDSMPVTNGEFLEFVRFRRLAFCLV
jgi:formylglycine-generating enzyme required for sulfatase activity